MKVLHINFSFTNGGIDNMMVDIMKHQMRRGLEVCLMVVNDQFTSDVKDAIPQGVTTFFVKRPPGSRNLYYILKIYWLINVCIRPAIVHCHNSDLGRLLRFDKHARLLTVHDRLLTVHDRLPTYGFEHYNWIATISHAVENDVRETFDKPIVSTIYNGTDFSLIKKRRGPSSNDTFRMVFVSRLVHYKKGHDLLLEALSKISLQIDGKIHLDIVGDGESKEFLTDMVARLGLGDIVEFTGAKERSWVYDHLKDYDLLVQPSRYEGFGLTIVEGFAAQISVLASDNDAPREILADGKYGYMFHSDDVESLSSVLLNIIHTSSQERWKKAKEEYNYMKEHFSIEATVDNYVQLYQQLTKKTK